MKPSKILLLILFFLACQQRLPAQEKSGAKFGKISPADFDLSKNTFDSGAAAVVIADIGSSEFEQSMRKFSLLFKHFKRIKILTKSGFNAANIEIPLYTDGVDIEKLDNLKAVTYNLQSGKITETKLDNNSVFTDKLSKNIILKKFTFPAASEGSIIEYSYTLRSDFYFNLQPWTFQGAYPCLWSEYEVNIPEMFNFVFLSQGYQPFYINARSNTDFNLTVTNRANRDELTISHSVPASDYRWVMKDVPALKEENFTTTLDNHLAKVEFQLSQYNPGGGVTENVMQNWDKIGESLLKDEYFGADLTSNNGWLDDELKSIIKTSSGNLEKATRIYDYLQSNYACTNHASLTGTASLKTIFKNKNGNEADINLLLVAILNHEKIPADPVILSTRDHGYPNEVYPLLARFNYVICSATIDGTSCYLDASLPRLGFGKLPTQCYNGFARVINKENPRAVYFYPDSVQEKRLTSVFIINDETKPGQITGSYQSTLGSFESYAVRQEINSQGEKDYFKTWQTQSGADVKIENASVDSLHLLNYPVKINCEFTFNKTDQDGTLYFSPVLFDGYSDNPFKSAIRNYPVEMPYTLDQVYTLNMEIPPGYIVDELPQSVKLSFAEGEGFFEYVVENDDANISLHSRIKLGRATYMPEDYNALRNFYAYIGKKQSEQIVFKKKK